MMNRGSSDLYFDDDYEPNSTPATKPQGSGVTNLPAQPKSSGGSNDQPRFRGLPHLLDDEHDQQNIDRGRGVILNGSHTHTHIHPPFVTPNAAACDQDVRAQSVRVHTHEGAHRALTGANEATGRPQIPPLPLQHNLPGIEGNAGPMQTQTKLTDWMAQR